MAIGRSKTKILLFAAVILLLASGASYYLFRHKHTAQKTGTSLTNPIVQQQNKIDYNPPSKQEQNLNNQQKDTIIKNQSGGQSTSTALSVTIVRTFQDPSGFNIRTIVNGTSDGSCNITFSKSGQTTVTKSFPVVSGTTSLNCQNTPIALSEFPVGGDWQLQVTVQNDTYVSPPSSTKVTINK